MNSVEVSICDNLEDFDQSESIKLNYSDLDIHGAPQILPHPLLGEKDIRKHDIPYTDNGIIKLYPNTNDLLNFDIFSASFFLLSRYEEYLPHAKDNHGRYKFSNSMACKHGFIETPIVDYWMKELFQAIKNSFPEFDPPKNKFQAIPTMDVDVAYAYHGRSFVRNLRSIVKDIITLNIKRLQERLISKSNGFDPFDTYDYFNRITEKFQLQKKHFFLLGDYGNYDKNLHHDNPALVSLIKSHTETAGSHPSYAVHNHKPQLEKEKKRLEKIIGQNVKHSRYHYLKFELPISFQQLIQLGYTEDYSMAYAEKMGFRTGTSKPYTFYDFSTNSPTDLIIFTTAVMDATCQDYLELHPDDAVKKIHSLIDSVRKVDGTFVLLWHNESLSDRGIWKGWRDVFHRSINYAAKKN